MSDIGCQPCGKNTYSDGAFSCTDCPDGKISETESASEADCNYGEH